jgi:hypothetical protein
MLALSRFYQHSLQNRYVRHGLTLFAVWYIFSIFVVPNRLDWIQWWYLLYFPLESVVFPLLLLIRGRAASWILVVSSGLIAAGLIFRLADMATNMIFARAFNPVLDVYLLSDGFHLLGSSLGYPATVVVSVLMALTVVLIIVACWLSLAHIRSLLWQFPLRWTSATLLVALLVWGVMAFFDSPKASRYFHDQLVSHIRNAVNSLTELRAFREVVNEDIYRAVPGDQLFGALQGKDVLMIFLESYGRVLLDSPRYADVVRPALEQATNRLTAQGYASSSAFLASSTIGGLSWLAHGTAMSGLWIDSQLRYDALMMSQRPTLIRLFQRAGWRTVGVMPAITLAWPEGQYYGYDQIYDAAALEYQGLPFNYVTMPDQFTLARFQQRERDPAARKPVMAEFALISSHAPWTPIPEVIDWNRIVDGTEFNEQAMRGPRTDQVWQDIDLLKSQYRDSVVYVLDTLVSYVENFGDKNLVLLVMGDHQPMPLIAEGASVPDVMVHIISADPDVMQAAATWQWTPGMLPTEDAPVWRMDTVRNRLIETFSPGMPAHQDAR